MGKDGEDREEREGGRQGAWRAAVGASHYSLVLEARSTTKETAETNKDDAAPSCRVRDCTLAKEHPPLLQKVEG